MAHLSLRPQPLGIFPAPTAYLVIPPVAGAEEVCAALLVGQTPDNMPDALRFTLWRWRMIARAPGARWRTIPPPKRTTIVSYCTMTRMPIGICASGCTAIWPPCSIL